MSLALVLAAYAPTSGNAMILPTTAGAPTVARSCRAGVGFVDVERVADATDWAVFPTVAWCS